MLFDAEKITNRCPPASPELAMAGRRRVLCIIFLVFLLRAQQADIITAYRATRGTGDPIGITGIQLFLVLPVSSGAPSSMIINFLISMIVALSCLTTSLTVRVAVTPRVLARMRTTRPITAISFFCCLNGHDHFLVSFSSLLRLLMFFNNPYEIDLHILAMLHRGRLCKRPQLLRKENVF